MKNIYFIWFYHAFSSSFTMLDAHSYMDLSNSGRGNPLLPLHGLLFLITARNLIYALSHRHDSYTSCGTLAGMRISSMGSPCGIDPMSGVHEKSEYTDGDRRTSEGALNHWNTHCLMYREANKIERNLKTRLSSLINLLCRNNSYRWDRCMDREREVGFWGCFF